MNSRLMSLLLPFPDLPQESDPASTGRPYARTTSQTREPITRGSSPLAASTWRLTLLPFSLFTPSQHDEAVYADTHSIGVQKQVSYRSLNLSAGNT